MNFCQFLDFFGFIPLAFCSRNYCSKLNHDMMANIWEKSHFNFGGKFEFGLKLSYHNCTIKNQYHSLVEVSCFSNGIQSGQNSSLILRPEMLKITKEMPGNVFILIWCFLTSAVRILQALIWFPFSSESLYVVRPIYVIYT